MRISCASANGSAKTGSDKMHIVAAGSCGFSFSVIPSNSAIMFSASSRNPSRRLRLSANVRILSTSF